MALSDGLIFHYNMNQAAGAARVDDINAYNLAENGGTVASTTGKIDNAANFNATPCWLNHATNSDFALNGSRSFQCWINITGATDTSVRGHRAGRGWRQSGCGRRRRSRGVGPAGKFRLGRDRGVGRQQDLSLCFVSYRSFDRARSADPSGRLDRGAVLFKPGTSDADSVPVFFWDFADTTTNGSDFAIVMDATGGNGQFTT